MKSDSTLAIFDYLLQHKNIQQRFYVQTTVNLVLEFSFKSSVPHTRMKEIHKLLSFSIYFSLGRRYVFLGPISMDMQIGNKDTGIKFICPENNCLWLKIMTS